MKYVITLLLCISGSIIFAQCEREKALNDYLNNYVANNFTATELNWNGSPYSCNPGSYNQQVNQKLLNRINYFRRIVGLNDDVVFDADLNQICQQAAVMLEVNETLSHCNGTNNYPCNQWSCGTSNAIYAAQRSVLASGHWSYYDPITLYIQDDGNNNLPVGHRRWLLYPRAKTFGTGITYSKSVIYVSDNFFYPTQNTKPYVAYPPEGYVPAPIVFKRWSFSLAHANFANAYVIMTDSKGYAVQLHVIYYNGNYGDPAIVWEPQNIQLNNQEDVTYTITIGGIQNSSQNTYTYQTTIIQPNHPPVCPNNMQWSETHCACRQPYVAPSSDATPTAHAVATNNCADQITLNNHTILTGLYSANEKVSSSGVINKQATVWFQAEDRITLQSNFKVKAGATFKAKINSCGN